MNINLPDLDNWNNYLKQITSENDNSSHNYLCIITRKYLPPKFRVLTKDEYVNFFKNHSLDTTCSKLSLSEIYSISEFFLNKKTSLEFREMKYTLATTQGNLLYYNTKISRFISELDISATDEFLKIKVENFIQNIKIIPLCLEKMNKRAIYKHQQEKIQGIWGKIKYYIWILFSDTQSHLKWDQENSVSLIKNKMLKEVKNRLDQDLCLFYELASLEQEMQQHRNSIDIKDNEININPQYIKQWMVKYGQGKYKYDSGLSEESKEKAEKARSRLISLYKFWELIESLDSVNSSPITIPLPLN